MSVLLVVLCARGGQGPRRGGGCWLQACPVELGWGCLFDPRAFSGFFEGERCLNLVVGWEVLFGVFHA